MTKEKNNTPDGAAPAEGESVVVEVAVKKTRTPKLGLGVKEVKPTVPPPPPRGRGRPSNATRKLIPRIKPGDSLPADVLNRSTDSRPIVYHDLPRFAAEHDLTGMDMMHHMGFNTSYQYIRDVKKSLVVPFDIELLLRLYENSPKPCRWKKPNILVIFEMIYGDLIEVCEDKNEEAMRMALSERFVSLLGRGVTVVYRWMTDSGMSSKRMLNILSKVEELGRTPKERRAAFEKISSNAWKLRGIEIDSYYPIPREENLSIVVTSVVSNRMKQAREAVMYSGGAFG